ncbi:MAG: hypothetical protein M3Q30_12305 [Actinomycetota bacterium]|nr:hypothetical protein [Actinomycetota bacterium]
MNARERIEQGLRRALRAKADALNIDDRAFDPDAPTGTMEPVNLRNRGRARWIALAAALLVVIVSITALVARATTSPDHTVNVITPPSTQSSTPASTRPSGSVSAHSTLPIAPAGRTGASMVFDPASKSVILFGGFGPYGTLADTWTWDGARWQQQLPATAATSRAVAGMAYAPALGKVLMLSGEAEVPLTDPCQRPANAAPVCKPASMFRDVSPGNDLWDWDGRTWHLRLAPGVSPKPDAMVTHTNGTVLVLASGQTWIYDGANWRHAGPGPDQMSEPVGVAVDPGTQRVIAIDDYQPGICMPHSGCQQQSYMRTFAWTGSAWKLLHDTNEPKPATSGGNSALVADPATRGLLMLAADHSTWLRSAAGNWHQVAAADASPPASDGMTLVADPLHREVIGFGGVHFPLDLHNFDPVNDTWVWDGTHWRVYTAPADSWPIPAPPVLTDCTLNGPSLLGSQKLASATEARIVASNLFTTPPCRLRATFTLTLRTADGKPLPVAGNPSTVTIDTTEPPGKSSISLEWKWSQPCAPSAVHADVQATGNGAFPTPFPIDLTPVPNCTGATHSTLSPLAPS